MDSVTVAAITHLTDLFTGLHEEICHICVDSSLRPFSELNNPMVQCGQSYDGRSLHVRCRGCVFVYCSHWDDHGQYFPETDFIMSKFRFLKKNLNNLFLKYYKRKHNLLDYLIWRRRFWMDDQDSGIVKIGENVFWKKAFAH